MDQALCGGGITWRRSGGGGGDQALCGGDQALRAPPSALRVAYCVPASPLLAHPPHSGRQGFAIVCACVKAVTFYHFSFCHQIFNKALL